MNRLCTVGVLTALVASTLVVVGCDSEQRSRLPGSSKPTRPRLYGSGSTFVEPMMKTWIEKYAEQNPEVVTIQYKGVGSGDGVSYMNTVLYDFGCTDAPMSKAQLADAKEKGGDVVHIPLAMGAVVAAYNLDDDLPPINFTGPVLADIFMGVIKTWDDDRLAKLNPGVKLPKLPIKTAHRSEKSGTTYVFTEYLCKVSPAFRSLNPKAPSTAIEWQCGVGEEKNDGVAKYVADNKGAIGYVELTYAESHGLKHGYVQNRFGATSKKEGEGMIRGSLTSVTAAADAAIQDMPPDLCYSLTDPPGKDSYPISGTVWAVMYKKNPSPEKLFQLLRFLDWVTHDGQNLTRELNYASLPEGLRERIAKKLNEVAVANDTTLKDLKDRPLVAVK